MTRLLPLNPDNPAPVQSPRPGEVLGGKYRIEREIGSGGMGIVYEVTHLVMTKKRFAVKWLLPLPDGYQGDDAQAASRRFVREAEIAGGINHPNVVEVYDVTVGESGSFMVMELLEGESLEARLKRDGRLPVAEACRIITACASGIGAAHAANVIHRDLKPANIFLAVVPGSEQSCPKVLDFGISRFTAPDGSAQSTVTRAGTLIGTPMYMAPEQLRGFECDERTDVYGLGVTLYEALSGNPAYSAPTHADLVVRIVTGDARELRDLDPSIPPALSTIVMQALHHKPEKRFASVQALMNALQRVAAEPVAGVSNTVLTAAPPRRRATWAVGLAVCVAALGLGVLGARWLASDASEPVSQPSAAKAVEPGIVRPKEPEPPAEPRKDEPELPPTATGAPVATSQPGDRTAPEGLIDPARVGATPHSRERTPAPLPANPVRARTAPAVALHPAPARGRTAPSAVTPVRPEEPNTATRTPKPRPPLEGL